MMDRSNGYDEIAERFVAARNPEIGAAIVGEWVQSLPANASALDPGVRARRAGRAHPDRPGCRVYAVGASLRLLEKFRKRFPSATIQHAAVEESEFFERRLDGIIAWGLMFLLPAESQVVVIRKAAKALDSNGKFLFTAPRAAVSWKDAMTGRESISLGSEPYRRILEEAGLRLEGEKSDEGENHYYFASKRVRESM